MQAWTRLIGHVNAERAAELLAKLFPDGLTFLTWDMDSQWAHSRMLLARIKDEDLYDDLIELAGEPFVAGVEEVHAELGEVLGLDEDSEAELEPSDPQLKDLVAALSESIGDYGRVLAGGVLREDSKAVARFLAAMAPIDRFRERNRRSGGAQADAEPAEDAQQGPDADDELDLDSPLPELPDEA